MNDFIFSDIPDKFKPLATSEFDDPLTNATGNIFNWTSWFARNFPTLSGVISRVPPALVSLVTKDFEGINQMCEIINELVEHEKNDLGTKNEDCVVQRLLNAHLGGESENPVPTPDPTVRSEAIGFTLAGTADPPNIMAFGTFMISNNSQLQEALYQELKREWAELESPIPSYKTLRQLPLLRGVVKESIRFTHGVATGPARKVGAGGARIVGYNVPAEAVVAVPSYFVHMDEAAFPNPTSFQPERWSRDDNSNSLVAFSRGRRMCPAEHFSLILLFATFATVFRRFHVTPYKTTEKDFEWNQYVSIAFSGNPLRAILRAREE